MISAKEIKNNDFIYLSFPRLVCNPDTGFVALFLSEYVGVALVGDEEFNAGHVFDGDEVNYECSASELRIYSGKVELSND